MPDCPPYDSDGEEFGFGWGSKDTEEFTPWVTDIPYKHVIPSAATVLEMRKREYAVDIATLSECLTRSCGFLKEAEAHVVELKARVAAINTDIAFIQGLLEALPPPHNKGLIK